MTAEEQAILDDAMRQLQSEHLLDSAPADRPDRVKSVLMDAYDKSFGNLSRLIDDRNEKIAELQKQVAELETQLAAATKGNEVKHDANRQ